MYVIIRQSVFKTATRMTEYIIIKEKKVYAIVSSAAFHRMSAWVFSVDEMEKVTVSAIKRESERIFFCWSLLSVHCRRALTI